MEIFFGEVSHFVTRFGALWLSDWWIQWSHDIIMRFDETLSLHK